MMKALKERFYGLVLWLAITALLSYTVCNFTGLSIFTDGG